MKRELAIILGVLVPFALLVAAAWWWPASAPPWSASPAVVAEAGPTPELPVRSAPVAIPDAGPGPDAGQEAQAVVPRELAAPLRAVQAEVRTCFEDQGTRAPGSVELTVSFTPTRDGGFTHVEVKSSWQDPYLTACVEDVFAEVNFHPTGAETFAPAQHVFRLAR